MAKVTARATLNDTLADRLGEPTLTTTIPLRIWVMREVDVPPDVARVDVPGMPGIVLVFAREEATDASKWNRITPRVQN